MINAEWQVLVVGTSEHNRGGFTALPVALLSGVAVAALTIVLVLFAFDPGRHSFYPACLFHQLTGWMCPGCGSLRAMHALLHGEIARAAKLNPLLLAGLPFLGWFVARGLLSAAGFDIKPATVRPVYVWIGLGVTAGFGLLRNLL